ncbi:JmjC domain [Plasmopara halstedii]|uniref:JmjC domain n=1 Tax=Plasmopara halstedii TaxID=4781 RepID=A0A0P1A579_PLAHL|nr:JmjC domain [Plasmopara halstedii]CEG35525.1 JmjC domain [Plasmopara halstedii]|eukprot:XP_024571894.1 JmjC domain [Plasmopara halstedii]
MAEAGMGADGETNDSRTYVPSLCPAVDEEEKEYGADDEKDENEIDSGFDFYSAPEFTVAREFDDVRIEDEMNMNKTVVKVEEQLRVVQETLDVEQSTKIVLEGNTMNDSLQSEHVFDTARTPSVVIEHSNLSTSTEVISHYSQNFSCEDTQSDDEIPEDVAFSSQNEMDKEKACDRTEHVQTNLTDKASLTKSGEQEERQVRGQAPFDAKLEDVAESKAAMSTSAKAFSHGSHMYSSEDTDIDIEISKNVALSSQGESEKEEASDTTENLLSNDTNEVDADKSDGHVESQVAVSALLDAESGNETKSNFWLDSVAAKEKKNVVVRDSEDDTPLSTAEVKSPLSKYDQESMKGSQSESQIAQRENDLPKDEINTPKSRGVKRKVAPVQTPKRSKRLAVRARKEPSPVFQSGKFGTEYALPLRRSSRLKSEPKEIYPINPVTSDTADMQVIKSEIANNRKALVQLMGSETLANSLKSAFQSTPFAGHASMSRFQKLVRNDTTGLRNLNVQLLLDAVETTDEPIVQLSPKVSGPCCSTACHVLESVSSAKARDLENCPLRFPAPPTIAKHFIRPLATELGLEYAMSRHRVKLVSCPKNETVLDWQFHRIETIVFILRGKSKWRLKSSQVPYPLACFHPTSWQLDDVAEIAKLHRLASNNSSTLECSAPSETFEIFEENAATEVTNTIQEHVLRSGSVVYIPAGVWFETETLGTNNMWLEVQLCSVSWREWISSAVMQLCGSDEQMRRGVQLYPSDFNQINSMRHYAESYIQALCREINDLDGKDLFPEYLASEEMQNLVKEGLVHVTTTPALTSFTVDLTNPRFSLKHVQVSRDAAYRVNPIAILLKTEEIPHLSPRDQVLAEHSTQKLHRALIKTPKPKPKRNQTLHRSHGGKVTYVLDENFGNDKWQSYLHVKFQCSTEQSKLVEYLRSRESEPFDLKEFYRCKDIDGKRLARDAESAQNLLRFLYFVGYVTQVYAP